GRCEHSAPAPRQHVDPARGGEPSADGPSDQQWPLGGGCAPWTDSRWGPGLQCGRAAGTGALRFGLGWQLLQSPSAAFHPWGDLPAGTADSGGALAQPVSDCQSGTVAGRPGTLEIERDQVTGDVQHFADEVEPGAVTGFHGARTDGGGIHATQGHLGGTVAFGGRRLDDPTIELAGDVQQLAVTELGQGF